MKMFFKLVQVIIGLIMFGVGVVITIHANIGYSPWDAFQGGLAAHTGISMGTIVVGIGVLILGICSYFKEKLGIASVLNMMIIGPTIDFCINYNLIPKADNLLSGLIQFFIGTVVIAVATYIYLTPALGVGPRDTLMVLLGKKAKMDVGVSRAIVEGTVGVLGWILGSPIGIGTVVFPFAIGFCVSNVFRIFKVDAKKIPHRSIKDVLLSTEIA